MMHCNTICVWIYQLFDSHKEVVILANQPSNGLNSDASYDVFLEEKKLNIVQKFTLQVLCQIECKIDFGSLTH